MRVVVTGASGFVGSQLAPALAQAGHEVVAVSRQARAWPSHARSGCARWYRPECGR